MAGADAGFAAVLSTGAHLTRRGPVEEFRAEVAGRLRSRRGEIEQATITRVHAISDPTDADPVYRDGLRATVSLALDYALDAIESGEERAPPPPTALFAQARMAARSGVGLDTVLRRYLAGYALLGDFLIEEVEGAGLHGDAALRRLLRGHAALFDRLLAAVSEEYERELHTYPQGSGHRRAERVRRLLQGELLDTSEFDYHFDRWHLAAVASHGALGPLRDLAAALDCRLFAVQADERCTWLWLGSRRLQDPDHARAMLTSSLSSPRRIAFGEPAEGLVGWRLSHRQAAAASAASQYLGEAVVRYRDVAVLAAVLKDDLTVSSLRQLFIRPIEQMRDGGELARPTLRAYFAHDRNVSAAAAALHVSRQAVTNRLQAVEAALDHQINDYAVELELALQLEAARVIDAPTPVLGHRPNLTPRN